MALLVRCRVFVAPTFRQHVDVSSRLSEGMGARQGSVSHASSHLMCCEIIDATIMVNASYDANSPCRPVSVYPSSQPSHMCSESTSITLPIELILSSLASTCPTRQRCSTSNTAPSLLLFVSSGQKRRKLCGLALYRSRISSPICVVLVLCSTPCCFISYAYCLMSGITSGTLSLPPLACGLADMRAVPVGASARNSAFSSPLASNNSSGLYDFIQLSSMARCAGSAFTSLSGTWCARKVPSTFTPSTSFGPVQPLGVRMRMTGQAGRDSTRRVVRAAVCMALISA